MTTNTTLIAVNGTLMRDLELNPNMVAVNAQFVCEGHTDACYRLWSIGERHPAMIRVKTGGAQVTLELWRVPMEGLGTLLLGEPAGLSIGKVRLADGSEVLGVIGEPWLVEGQPEITRFGGWRAYIAQRQAS